MDPSSSTFSPLKMSCASKNHILRSLSWPCMRNSGMANSSGCMQAYARDTLSRQMLAKIPGYDTHQVKDLLPRSTRSALLPLHSFKPNKKQQVSNTHFIKITHQNLNNLLVFYVIFLLLPSTLTEPKMVCIV